LWYNQDDGLGSSSGGRYVFMESFEGRLVRTREESVLEYEAEPAFADSLFYVEPQPGFNVADRVTNRRYRVGLPGQPDRDLAELAMEMDRGYRNTARRLLLLSMSLLLFLVGGFLCIHYVKRRKDRPV
jgi:hypothetical protein